MKKKKDDIDYIPVMLAFLNTILLILILIMITTLNYNIKHSEELEIKKVKADIMLKLNTPLTWETLAVHNLFYRRGLDNIIREDGLSPYISQKIDIDISLYKNVLDFYEEPTIIYPKFRAKYSKF